MNDDVDPSTEPAPITVVLADDHELVRDGIRMVLEAEADIEVVARRPTPKPRLATCSGTSRRSLFST